MLYFILSLGLLLPSFAESEFASQTSKDKMSEEVSVTCECYAVDADQALYYGSSRRSVDQAMQRAIAYCMIGTQLPGTCEIHQGSFCGCR